MRPVAFDESGRYLLVNAPLRELGRAPLPGEHDVVIAMLVRDR